MVRIRLERIGKRKEAHYRVIIIDSKERRNGRAIEVIGAYNPKLTENKVTLNLDKYNYWVKCGAQPTNLLKSIVKKQYSAQPQ